MNMQNTSISPSITKLGHSMKEAEEMTGLCRTTLWKAMRNKKLKFFKVGRRVLFSDQHLRDFLQQHEHRTKAASGK